MNYTNEEINLSKFWLINCHSFDFVFLEERPHGPAVTHATYFIPHPSLLLKSTVQIRRICNISRIYQNIN